MRSLFELKAVPEVFHDPDRNHHSAIDDPPLRLARLKLFCDYTHNLMTRAFLARAPSVFEYVQNTHQRFSPTATTTA